MTTYEQGRAPHGAPVTRYAYRRGLANAADFVVVRINDDGTEDRLCTLVCAQGLHHEDDARRLVALLNGDDR